MDVTIRPASPHDSDTLSRIHDESWRAAGAALLTPAALDQVSERLEADHYREMIENPGTPRAGTWVVEADGAVVGFAHFRDAPDGQTGEILCFYLLASTWGTGAARRLLDATLDDMRGLGFGRASLEVFPESARACRFLEKAGFVLDDPVRWEEFGGETRSIVRYLLAL
jgi:RimJ/RimL family protein N-acetyltransferase